MNYRIKLLITIMIFITVHCVFASPQKVSNPQNSLAINSFLHKIGYSEIPIIKKNGLLYIRGKVENKSVYFLLDTGSIESSILSDGIKTLKLTPIQSKEKIANMTGGIKFAQKALLPQAKVGNIQLGTISANITEQPFTNDLPTVIIGNKFFNQYNAVFDIDHNSLYLNKEAASKKNWHELNQLLKENYYQKTILTRLDSGHYLLPVQINNATPAYFLFDTGTGGTTISIPYMNYLKIRPNDPFQTQGATDGTITTTEITLKDILFNPLQTFFEQPVELKNSNIASANIASMTAILGVVGIVGLCDIEKLHAIIVIPTQALFLKD